MHAFFFVWMHESSPPLYSSSLSFSLGRKNQDAYFETFCLFFFSCIHLFEYILLSTFVHVCIVKTFKYMHVVLRMYILCLSLYMYVHVYVCNDMYVKQDHYHRYLHSLSYVICCIHNRTINSDAHFETLLMKSQQEPLNNFHRKHHHQ